MNAPWRIPRRKAGAVLAGAATVLAVAACGSSGPAATAGGQGPAGRYPVSVKVRFPASQSLAQPTVMRVLVRNTGRRALPDVAVTICNRSCAASARSGEGTAAAAFSYDIQDSPTTADPSRPLWIVQHGPGGCRLGCHAGGGSAGGAVTANSNTWALGRLAPGQVARFQWALTPVVAGSHVVAWEVAGDLTGAARATLAGGAAPRGTVRVSVSSRAAHTRVLPSGRVVTAASGSGGTGSGGTGSGGTGSGG